MKALSVTRPWSELIMRGKTVENRTWSTRYRGPILIHAAKSWAAEAMEFAQWVEITSGRYAFSDLSWRPGDHATGVVGVADLVGVCSASATDWVAGPCACGPWAMADQHHWRLANVRRLIAPIPVRGALGLWNPPAEVLAEVERQLATAVAR